MNPKIYQNRTSNSRWTRMLTFVVALVTSLMLSYNLKAQCIIGTGTTTSNGSATDPVERYYNYEHIQIVYLASELSAGGILSGNGITALGFSISESAVSLANYTISIGHTTQTLANPMVSTGLSVVKNAFTYTPTVQTAGNFDMINFDSNFIWNGTDNIVIDICTGSNPFTSPYGGLRYTAASAGAMRTIRQDGSTVCGNYTSGSGSNTNASYRPNIRLNYMSLTPCTTPTPGNTISSVASVCSGANFTLSLQNSTPGITVSYQWQSADDAGFTVNAANLGTSSTQVTNQTSAKYYRCVVTCSVGPTTGISNPIQVPMNSSSCQCLTYCASAFTNVTYEFVTNVNFAGINNTSAGTIGGPVNYTGFSGAVVQGSTYPLSVTIDPDANDYVYAWIDWNQNGTLSDAGETYTLVTNTGSAGPHTLNVAVPNGATVGSTRMRVMVDWNNAVPNPCRSATYGEAEDYCISVSAPPPCAGSPTPGNTIASANSVCSGGTVNLSLQNATPGTGVTYDWWADYGSGYSSTGVTTASFTTPALTATSSFFCVVTCASGPSLFGVSTPTTVNISSPPVGGTASGPSSALTYQNLAYSVTGTTGSLQWQFSTTAVGGPYTDIPSANAPTLNINANGAGTYYVRCKAFNPGCTDDFSNVITTVVTVAGDNVCSALPLSVGLNGPFTNAGATTEVGEPVPPASTCTDQAGWCVSGISNSVWFSFVAPPSGRVSIGNNGNFNLWDNQMALYSANSCGDILTGGGTLLAANDDSLLSSSPFKSWIAPICLIPGQTYYLQVEGYATTTNVAWGLNLVEETSILPTASISGTTEICSGGNTNLTLNFTGTAPWTYSINGGAPQSTSNNPETVNVAPGATTTYTLTSLGDNSCPGGSGIVSGSATVTVSTAPPSGSCTITTIPTSACVGNTVSVSTTVSPGATGYTWSTPAGTLINGLASPQTTVSNTVNITLGAVPANASGWEICAFASNACGNTNTNCKYIRGTLSTPAAISGSTVACPSTGPTNYSTLPVTGATSYAWTISGDASVTGTGTTGAVTFGPSFTSGTLCVKAQLPCGYQSVQRCLTINNATPTLGTMTGTFTVCPGTNGVAYGVPASPGAFTYNWTVPTGATIATGAGTSSVTVDFGPTYNGGNICVTASSICGANSAPRCRTVVSNKPGTPGNFTSGATSGVCGQTITYAVNAVAGATSYTWTAQSGATLASPNGNNSIDVTYSGGYTTGNLCVTANNACGSSAPRCVLIKGTPSNPGTISGPAVVCADEAGDVYSIAPLFGATGYIWSTPAGTTINSGQGTTSINIDWGNNGGVIGVTATGLCGNSGTKTLNVIMNCRMSSSTLPGATLSAYPNPVSTKLNIELNADNAGKYVVELTDLSGRIVYSTEMTASEGINSNVIDVATYAKGIYTLSVKNNDGFAKQIRVAVE